MDERWSGSPSQWSASGEEPCGGQAEAWTIWGGTGEGLRRDSKKMNTERRSSRQIEEQRVNIEIVLFLPLTESGDVPSITEVLMLELLIDLCVLESSLKARTQSITPLPLLTAKKTMLHTRLHYCHYNYTTVIILPSFQLGVSIGHDSQSELSSWARQHKYRLAHSLQSRSFLARPVLVP